MSFSYITCTVLTWQVPKIEVYISEHSVFPTVNVWVWQQGAWKQHPCNSDARITLIFLNLVFYFYSLFIPYLFLFPILFFIPYLSFIPWSFFIPFLFFIPYKLITSLSACINTSMHVWWGQLLLMWIPPHVGSLWGTWMMNTSFSHLVDNEGEGDGFNYHDVWRRWRPQDYQKQKKMMHLQPYWENWRNI